jgi:hypothetical protein
MALKDVKARIATVLQGVPGIGKVYARMRPVNVEAVELAQFVADGVLNLVRRWPAAAARYAPSLLRSR